VPSRTNRKSLKQRFSGRPGGAQTGQEDPPSSPSGAADFVIHVTNRQKDLPLSAAAVRRVVRALILFEAVSCQEIGVHFVTASRICRLHAQFFNDPSPTDCITFPIDDAYLGDIFVCPHTALQYAAKRGIDPREEATLYLVHGFLHLLGYDDTTRATKLAMRKKEKQCMAHLKSLGILL
jgi:probable rRNA maturation factor